jgi:AbrB family looped-hinge helix DNA binding protein
MLSTHTKIGGGGRVVIPAEYREKLGLKEGDTVSLRLDESGIRISTARLAIKRIQEIAKKLVPPGVSLADELIAERREQAKRNE